MHDMADRLFADTTLAALYDSFCPRGRRDDFDFYMPMVMAAEAVLDVGCGTGAMLHEARDAGHQGRLCGLDPASGMIEQARKRSDIEWVLGDLTSCVWGAEFDLVVMTGHAFQVLIEDADLRTSLTAIAAALTPSGVFAFETRNPKAREWERWKPEHAALVTDPDGRTVRMSRQIEAPFDGNVVSFSHTFSSPDWDQVEVSNSTLRFIEAELLARFLAEAGLEIEAQFGDWDRSPLTDASPEIITLARLAEKA